jgi:hypothetical protein
MEIFPPTPAEIQADALARIATVLEALLRIVEMEITTKDHD